MTKDLCWVGHSGHHNSLSEAVRIYLDRQIIPARDAAEGLEAISQKNYSLILFSSPTPVGSLALPDGINPRDFASTDDYLIRQIRGLRPRTPLVVVHLSGFPYNQPDEALRNYKRAGATDAIDLFQLRLPNDFTRILQKHL